MNRFDYFESNFIQEPQEIQEENFLYDNPFQQQKAKLRTRNTSLSLQMNNLDLNQKRKTKKRISKRQKQRNNLQKKIKKIVNQSSKDAQYIEAAFCSYELQDFDQVIIQLFSTQESNHIPQSNN